MGLNSDKRSFTQQIVLFSPIYTMQNSKILYFRQAPINIEAFTKEAILTKRVA